MRFFVFSLFLLLLFDSPQGSTLPSKKSLGELNTTLKTNVDGTYQKINPCTQKEIQSTSCVGSHEFSHHVSGENWSDYSLKCSAIIKSFLQAIGNLVRFGSTPNGTFNFNINTSITHKDGHCDSQSQSRRPIPTIIIEATGCEVPSVPCDSPVEKDENGQMNISQQSAKEQHNSDELITVKPNLKFHGDSKTSQDVTEIIGVPVQDSTPKHQAERFQGEKSKTPGNVTPTGTVQVVLPFVPQPPPMRTTHIETSAESFTEISKIEQNSHIHRSPNRPISQPNTNSLTLLPEQKFTTPVPPPPNTFSLGIPSGVTPNIPKERGFVPQRIPQPTTMGQFTLNPHQPAPVGLVQPPNDNSRQLFNDELREQAPVNQQSANFFPSPNQIPVTNLPSTDGSNAFTEETQLERPFAYPVASSHGEPQPVELPFSKPPSPPRAPSAGTPAPNHSKHFPNQLRTTTPFPPTMVKPEFDELPGQGLVTRPPLTKNDFFNGPGKSFPHDQRPELPIPPPPTQTPVINTDNKVNEGPQGLTIQTLPINQPVHRVNTAFTTTNSSKFPAVHNRNQQNKPRVFHENQPTGRISQAHQQLAAETVDLNRFPVNKLPRPAFGRNFHEKPGMSYHLNPFEHSATPRTQTPPPQSTASPQTPPEPLPQPTANLDIPQPQPTLPYEDKPHTTPAPELHSSVEETNYMKAVTPNSGYINQKISAPFTRPEPHLKSHMQIPPIVLPQQTGHFNKVQPPQTTTPEPSTTIAPELTSSFDYDYQYPNYEGTDYDYPVHQSPNSTSEHPQNPLGSVHRQFHPRARAPIRKLPQNFSPRHHPMRYRQMRHYPHSNNHKNNMKFINATIPDYYPEYDYEYVDGVAPEQMPDYYYDYDYPEYPQFPVNVPHRRFPPNFVPQRHRIRNFNIPPHFGKPFKAGIPTSFERTPGLNHVLQHNNNEHDSDYINPPNIQTQPETQFTAGTPPIRTLPPEESQTVQPVLTTTAYENETLTTEFQTTAEPEYHPSLEPVHQTAEGKQHVLDDTEQQAPNFNQPELQLGPTDHTFPPRQLSMRHFEAPQPHPGVRKFENETISANIQTTTEPHYQPSVELNNQNIKGRLIGQMPNFYNPGHQVPNGFFRPRQPFRGGAPFHRGFPVHQQPIRNFRPNFTPKTPENKSKFQSTEKPEFGNQFINRRNPGQISNSHFAGQVPNTFNQPQPQLRGNAHAVHPVGWVPPSGEHSSRNLEIGQPGPNPPTLENESRITVQPEFQPEQDNQNTKDRKAEKIPDSHFAEGHVQNFHQAETLATSNEPIFPMQPQNFATNQPDITTYENETVTTDFQTTVIPEYQPHLEPVNQHTDGKQISPSPVPDFKGHQNPNADQSQLLMRDNHHPGQIFPPKQQQMNFPQSRHSSEGKTISRDFQAPNQHHFQPHVEHDSRHIGNRWTGERPNSQFRGQQVPNTFPQPGQQFRGGVPFLPSLHPEQPPVRILKNLQPQLSTAAHEDVTTAAPEHPSSLESHQSVITDQQTLETQNLGLKSDSQLTKSPPASSSKQEQERNLQISQPRPISGRTNEEETFRTAPQPSHENVTDRADSAEQQNQNNFDLSRLNVPSRQFPLNISPQPPMETSQTLQPNPPAQPTQKFQPPVQYNRAMPNLRFRNPQNPKLVFHSRPHPHFHAYPPNFILQQQPVRNIQMGPPRRIHKNETIMTDFQETKPQTQNFENHVVNNRRPDLLNHDFINHQNTNHFGRPESQVRAHFQQFPPGMRQIGRNNGPSFVKRPPMEFPPSRGSGRIPESVPGPFSDTRTASRFVNPPNNNQPVVNRHNFQPETALIHSDRNLDYDIPTSFYNSRPTPNENQPEPQPDLIPGVRTSDEYLSATSSDETNTTSPPLPNTSVDYEQEENVPLAVSSYPGQVLNDNVTTPKPNTSALYSEQITPIISSPRWQPPADISTSENKNSLNSQPPLTRPEPLHVVSKSESTEQAFGGDQPPVTPVRKEHPSDFSANPYGNPARAEDTADILEKPIERNNPVLMPQSNSFVPRDSTTAFSFQHQNQPFLNTPGNRPLVNLGTTVPPHIDTTTTTFEQVTSESYRNGNIPFQSLTNPQPISVGGPRKLSPETHSPAAPFIPSNQLHPAIENPITDHPLGPSRHFPAPVGHSRVPPVSKPSISTSLNSENQKPFEKRNLQIERPHPLVLGPPNHSTPSPQPIHHQQHNQRTPERNFNSEKQQMAILSQQLKKPEVPQQLSMNRQSDSAQSAEVQKMALEQPKWDAIGTTTFPPQSQPSDVPFSQPNHQNFNSANSFVTSPVNQQSNAIHLNQQSPIQISSDISRPQADSFIQAGTEVEHRSVISANDRQPPVDFNLQKIPFKHIPAASPQLHQPGTVVKTRPKISTQQFDVHQRTNKFPQTPSSKLTTTTYEEVTTTTDSPQPTYYTGIPVQLLKSPVNAPTKFSDTSKQTGNPDFVHSELPPPVTEATSSQVSPPYGDEINPTSQTNFEYAHEKISSNFPPPVVEPQPQPAIQDYKTKERPVLKLKPKTLAIVIPKSQQNFTNAENSNRQLQATFNIPPPTLSAPDQHYPAATSLKTSETAHSPIPPLHEKHDQQRAHDNLKFIDNSPQTQPTTAVKYPEKIQTAEYEPSPIPRPQPQTALNNSGRQSKDNSANVWADQQQLITSSPGFGITPSMTNDQTPTRNTKTIDTQSKLPPQHPQNPRTTPQTHNSRTTETYEQDIITTDNPHRQTPQPVLIPSRNLYNQLTASPHSITHETVLNPSQQITVTEDGHSTSQISESQLTIPKYQASLTLDHSATSHTSESIYSEQELKKQSDSLLLVPLSQEHHNSETKEEVVVTEKTTTVPPSKLVTKIPDTVASIEHKSVTLVRNPPRKTKIVEEIVTTELPKHIVNSPVSAQLAFAEKLLNYENKKLTNLQQVTTPSPVVENNHSSTLPTGSSSHSEHNSQIVFGGNAFPNNFEKDNKHLEGSSPPNHVSTSTPQRPQNIIFDNPTSSFDDYDQQHSTQSPDMFPEYDEIPPNFNARTGLTKGHPNEKSHVTFPMELTTAIPQPSVNSRRTTPTSNDSLASKTRNDVTATPQPGFLPSLSTPSNLQDHPTTERYTSASRPDGSMMRSMTAGKEIQPIKKQVQEMGIKTNLNF